MPLLVDDDSQLSVFLLYKVSILSLECVFSKLRYFHTFMHTNTHILNIFNTFNT